MDRDQRGFTLVEVMVVVAIVAVLLAIAVPMFISLRSRADDASAKSSAVTAIKVAKSLLGPDSYGPVTLAELTATEPSLTFVDGATNSTGPTVVSQVSPDPAQQTFVLSVYSVRGTCFFIRDDLSAGTTFGSLEGVPATDCRADNAGGVVFGSGW